MRRGVKNPGFSGARAGRKIRVFPGCARGAPGSVSGAFFRVRRGERSGTRVRTDLSPAIRSGVGRSSEVGKIAPDYRIIRRDFFLSVAHFLAHRKTGVFLTPRPPPKTGHEWGKCATFPTPIFGCFFDPPGHPKTGPSRAIFWVSRSAKKSPKNGWRRPLRVRRFSGAAGVRKSGAGIPG